MWVTVLHTKLVGSVQQENGQSKKCNSLQLVASFRPSARTIACCPRLALGRLGPCHVTLERHFCREQYVVMDKWFPAFVHFSAHIPSHWLLLTKSYVIFIDITSLSPTFSTLIGIAIFSYEL